MKTNIMKTTKPKSLLQRVQFAIAVLGLAAFGTGVASASYPVLFNGNLNIVTYAYVDAPGYPPAGWNALGIQSLDFPDGGWTDCECSEPWANGIADPNIYGYGIFCKPFEGSTNAFPFLDNLASLYFYQDNPTTPNTTFTLSAYASAGPNYSGYNTSTEVYDAVSGTYVTPETGLYVVFFNNSGGILQSNYYDLITAGLSLTNEYEHVQPTIQYTTPVYTAPVGTVTVRAGLLMAYQWLTTYYDTPSLFADDFDLEATPPPGSPVITAQPNAAVVAPGGNAQFSVVTSPAATSYVWNLNGTTITNGNEFSGATAATLKITGATTNDVGYYQVFVSNSNGGSFSQSVPLAFNGLILFPTVTLIGTIGATYEIDRSSAPNGPWTAYTTVRLTTSPQHITDYTLPVAPNESYRQLFLHAP